MNGNQAQLEHLLKIWRTLRDIDGLVDEVATLAREIFNRGADDAVRSTWLQRMRSALGTCFAEVSEIDSGVADLA